MALLPLQTAKNVVYCLTMKTDKEDTVMASAFERLWCRTFQAVLKVGNYFMGYRMPHCLEGAGKIRELGAFLQEKHINDVLVVTGAGLYQPHL